MLQAKRFVILSICCVFLGGCASGYVSVAPLPPQTYQKLGPAKGTACGSLGVAGTAYYVVPMALNSRVERAVAYAVKSVPGATSLINVTLEEDWFWWAIGTARCVTVTGEAIQ